MHLFSYLFGPFYGLKSEISPPFYLVTINYDLEHEIGTLFYFNQTVSRNFSPPPTHSEEYGSLSSGATQPHSKFVSHKGVQASGKYTKWKSFIGLNWGNFID